MVYGTEMLHAKVRELLVAFVQNNANKFRVYITEGSHLKHAVHTNMGHTSGTVCCSLIVPERDLYLHSNFKKDGMYAWIKMPPYPPHVELVFLSLFPPRARRTLTMHGSSTKSIISSGSFAILLATTMTLYGLLMDFTPL
jgi:hypothetical protein